MGGEQARVPAGSPEGGEFGSGGGDLHVHASRKEWAARPGRESLGKKLGKVAFQIRERDAHRCVYCGTHEKPGATGKDRHQLDHLVPRVQGGEDKAENLVTACSRCNQARHEMSVKEWSAYAKVKYGVQFDPKKVYAQAKRPLPELKQSLAELKKAGSGFRSWAFSKSKVA